MAVCSSQVDASIWQSGFAGGTIVGEVKRKGEIIDAKPVAQEVEIGD